MMGIRPLSAILLLFCISLSCGVVKNTTSLSTHVQVKEHTEYVPVLVKVAIPEVKIERWTLDTMSVLETKMARSVAIVRPGCKLYHSIEDIPQELESVVDAKIIYRDSIVFVDKVVNETVEVQVPSKLTWWQRVRLDGFYILLLICLLFAGRIVLKFYLM